MDEAFLAALFPGEYRILGFRLEPFCLGHVATLHAIRSPLVAEPGSGARILGKDLVAALRICAAPGWPLLSPSRLRPSLRAFLVRRWLDHNRARLRCAVEAFRAYQNAHCSFPTFYAQEAVREDADVPEDFPTDSPLSAPFALARVCALTSRTTITEERAWTMPLAMPAWISGALNELEGGDTRFLSEAQDTAEDLPPDTAGMTEAAMYAQALKDLGPERAKQWQDTRRKKQRADKRKAKKKAP